MLHWAAAGSDELTCRPMERVSGLLQELACVLLSSMLMEKRITIRFSHLQLKGEKIYGVLRSRWQTAQRSLV